MIHKNTDNRHIYFSSNLVVETGGEPAEKSITITLKWSFTVLPLGYDLGVF